MSPSTCLCTVCIRTANSMAEDYMADSDATFYKRVSKVQSSLKTHYGTQYQDLIL